MKYLLNGVIEASKVVFTPLPYQSIKNTFLQDTFFFNSSNSARKYVHVKPHNKALLHNQKLIYVMQNPKADK